jgi:hypothetical protein
MRGRAFSMATAASDRVRDQWKFQLESLGDPAAEKPQVALASCENEAVPLFDQRTREARQRGERRALLRELRHGGFGITDRSDTPVRQAGRPRILADRFERRCAPACGIARQLKVAAPTIVGLAREDDRARGQMIQDRRAAFVRRFVRAQSTRSRTRRSPSRSSARRGWRPSSTRRSSSR